MATRIRGRRERCGCRPCCPVEAWIDEFDCGCVDVIVVKRDPGGLKAGKVIPDDVAARHCPRLIEMRRGCARGFAKRPRLID